MSALETTETKRINRIVSIDAENAIKFVKGESYQLYRNNFEIACANKEAPATPIQISVEATSYCNLKCKMC